MYIGLLQSICIYNWETYAIWSPIQTKETLKKRMKFFMKPIPMNSLKYARSWTFKCNFIFCSHQVDMQKKTQKSGVSSKLRCFCLQFVCPHINTLPLTKKTKFTTPATQPPFVKKNMLTNIPQTNTSSSRRRLWITCFRWASFSSLTLRDAAWSHKGDDQLGPYPYPGAPICLI